MHNADNTLIKHPFGRIKRGLIVSVEGVSLVSTSYYDYDYDDIII